MDEKERRKEIMGLKKQVITHLDYIQQ